MPPARKGLRATAPILSALLLILAVVGGCRNKAPAGPATWQAGKGPPAAGQPPAGSPPAAGPADPVPPPAQAEWDVPPGEPVFRARMGGWQVYKAVAGANGRLSWTLVGPKAELKNEAGEPIMRHYKGTGGPVWEWVDGSAVVGKKLHERPSRNAGAVPELQLEARPVGGAGAMSGVTLIERVNTFGGLPPADPAPPAYRAGDTAEVRYSAEYVFYAPAE